MSRVQSLLRNEWVLLGLVIAISIFFRLYQLDTIPLGLHSDEAVMGYHARHILQTKEAVQVFNSLSRQGVKVGGIFHSTC